MPEKKFTSKQEGIDYFFLIVRHIDRMSDGLTQGLNIGEINTKKLITYYQQILHFESLISPFLNEEYVEKRKKITNKFPGYASTWSALEDNIEFFESISKLFKLLIAYAYNNGVLKIKIKKEYRADDEILD